jgi:hypothetical protein
LRQAVAVVTDSDGNWSLDKLLVRADKKNRAILIEQEKTAKPFVSWLIYGASQSSIQNPISLAIARLKENPEISAGGCSERMAAFPPTDLARLVEQALSYRLPSDRNWKSLFEGIKMDRIYLLSDSLGLDLVFEKESDWRIN